MEDFKSPSKVQRKKSKNARRKARKQNNNIPALKVEELSQDSSHVHLTTKVIDDEFKISPLTSKQEGEVREVRRCYEDFWENIKFRKGWETVSPYLNKQKVIPYLDEAAEIVVRIRSFIDSKNPNFKLRMRDGSAREFLWDIQHGDEKEQQKYFDEPDQFIKQIVHSTFKDANGYVEGLSEAQINRFIQVFQENRPTKSSFDNLSTQWSTTQDLMTKILQLADEKKNCPEVKSILRHLNGIIHEAEHVLKSETKQEQQQPEQTQTQPQTQQPQTATSSGTTPMEVDEKSEPKVSLPKSTDVSEDDNSDLNTSFEETDDSMEDGEGEEELTEEQKLEKEKKEKELQNEIRIDSIEEVDPNTATTATPTEKTEQESVTHEPTISLPEDQVKNKEETPSVEEPKQKDPSILKIEVIANEVDQLKPEIKSLQDAADQLEIEQLSQNATEGKKLVEKLQKKCLAYVEGLMKDLLTLDAITASQEVRPLRKAQVSTIQKMIDDVDVVNKKLKGFSENLKEKYEKEEQERIEKEKEEKRIQEERMIEENKKKHQEKDESANLPKLDWKLLKLNPKFDISETQKAYIIACYIPGLDSNSIKIQLSKNGKVISIEGVREPTEQELKQLKMKLQSRFRGEIDPYTESQFMMKAGSGRYGKFSESYQLPESVDNQNIGANYEGGVLKVTIPKVERKRVLPPQYGRHNPYFQHPNNSYQNSFYDDNDFWW